MSHVREGEIHAYLDGALDRLGDARADQVRDHLAVCEDCRGRLDEERRVRGEADRLLDLGAPVSFEIPPFEDIRRRAAAVVGDAHPVQGEMDGGVGGGNGGGADEVPDSARTARRVLGRTQQWAWAASLVLALGTGWILRGSGLVQAGRPAGGGTFADSDAAEVSAGPSTVQRAASSSDEPTAAMPTPGDRTGIERAGPSPRPGMPEEPRDSRQVAEGVAQTASPPSPAVAESVRAPEDESRANTVVGNLITPAGIDSLRAKADGRADAVAPDRERAEEEALSPAETVTETDLADRDDLGVPASAEALPGFAPGLEVVDVTGDSSLVRVAQRFPEGDTLVIEYLSVEGAYGLLGSELAISRSRETFRPSSPGRRVQAVPGADTGAARRRIASDRTESVVRIRRGSGLVVVRSLRTQAELEALLRSWGWLIP